MKNLILILAAILIITGAFASTCKAAAICEEVEYYSPVSKTVITEEACFDSSVSDHEIDEEEGLDSKTVINERLPVEGETGFEG